MPTFVSVGQRRNEQSQVKKVLRSVQAKHVLQQRLMEAAIRNSAPTKKHTEEGDDSQHDSTLAHDSAQYIDHGEGSHVPDDEGTIHTVDEKTDTDTPHTVDQEMHTDTANSVHEKINTDSNHSNADDNNEEEDNVEEETDSESTSYNDEYYTETDDSGEDSTDNQQQAVVFTRTKYIPKDKMEKNNFLFQELASKVRLRFNEAFLSCR